MDETAEKWNRIYSEVSAHQPDPALILKEHAFLLPPAGSALDLACGLGGNALFLAGLGWDVQAWDVSQTAIDFLREQAGTQGLKVNAKACPAECLRHENSTFDLIIVSRFLDRTLKDAIIGALKDNGLLYYQTFTRVKTRPQGPNNPDYLLAENELLTLFAPLKVLFYREYGTFGDLSQGLRNEAQLIGRKHSGRLAI